MALRVLRDRQIGRRVFCRRCCRGGYAAPFADKVIADYGHVDFLIHNALPLMKGIDACSYEEFNYALRVGVTAPFYLTKLFVPYFAPGRRPW